MRTFRLKVRQVFRVERECLLEVKQSGLAAAIEQIESGAMAAPDYDAPVWVSFIELQTQHAMPVSTKEITLFAKQLAFENAKRREPTP